MATRDRESINKRKRSVLPNESEEEEEQTMTHYESITNQTNFFSLTWLTVNHSLTKPKFPLTWPMCSSSLKRHVWQLECFSIFFNRKLYYIPLEFVEVTNEVNIWAEKETNGLIKEIIPQGSINDLTRLVFANALYFKGSWNQKFDPSITKDYHFHLTSDCSVKVPFMTSEKKQFIRAFDGFKVLGLPYKQGEDKRKFTMYFFLPNAKDGLPALVEKVASESDLLQHKLPFDKVEVGDFRIPKFNISFGLETSDMLKELGVVLPFYAGGLTKMVNSSVSKKLFVSNIFHKSFIEVNEEGTEAAAISVLFMQPQCMRRPTRMDFVADHPFLYLIRDDLTGTIIFVGQVLNPLDG